MARSFDGTGDGINFGSSVYDFTSNWTIAGWFFVRNTGGGALDMLWNRWTNSTTNRQVSIYADGFSHDPSQIQIDIPWVAAILTGSTGLSVNTWYHVAVKRSGNDWTVYLNGSSDGTTTNASAHETGGSLEFGVSTAGGSAYDLDGAMAEWVGWNVALDAGEVLALSKGYSPRLVRPSALKFYAPLTGRASAEPDIVGGNSGTVTGATQLSHPRVIYPRRRQVKRYAAAAPAATQNLLTLLGVG